MAYKALYRVWRPQTFSEVVGQKHITTTLKNAVDSGRIAHAYLLCGTRGTGKTTTAKILAKAVNCLNPQDGDPCNECEMCQKISKGLAIDVVEMDAASKNKVENIRDIIEEVQIPPSEAKYKVYIIDEVHMLTIGAVNAFLKTLEEPPKNVIFILATTDPQKLPITILSRCQRYDFKRINHNDIKERLREIVTNSGILADENSLDFISRICDGAMRDAVSILDQCMSMGDGAIRYEDVLSMVGMVTNDKLIQLVDYIIDRDITKSMNLVDDIIFNGKDVGLLIKECITHFRNLLMVKVSNNPEELVDMSKENIAQLKEQSNKIRTEEIMRFINILNEADENTKWSKQSRVYIEIAIIKMCKIEFDTSPEMILARVNKLESSIRSGAINVNAQEGKVISNKDKKVKSIKTVISEEKNEENIERNLYTKLTLDDIKKKWNEVLELLKGRRLMSLYAYVSPGRPTSFKEGVLDITFSPLYGFAKKNLDSNLEQRTKVEEIFTEVLKEKIRIRYMLDKDEEEKSKEQQLKELYGDSIEFIEE